MRRIAKGPRPRYLTEVQEEERERRLDLFRRFRAALEQAIRLTPIRDLLGSWSCRA
jgi:hypothetical protein